MPSKLSSKPPLRFYYYLIIYLIIDLLLLIINAPEDVAMYSQQFRNGLPQIMLS